jgi:hypothetical protein
MSGAREGRLRVIVLGFLVREPTGQAWHYLNYVRGLADLGHDVYYIEDSDDVATCYDGSLNGPTTDPTVGLRFASRVFDRAGLGDRWAYFDAHANAWKGARAGDARQLCESADLVLNVSGINPLRGWFDPVPARAMIDTDPGFTQIRNLTVPRYRKRSEAHTRFFSFGENIGKPGCTVPADGFCWQPTRQPVALTAWPCAQVEHSGKYTTVMQWQSFTNPYTLGGLRLAMKSESFASLSHLPRQLGDIFEIALRGDAAAHAALRNDGWGIADIDALSLDPWAYQRFIQNSKAEIGIAKAGYLVTRSGWFSEQSAGYLASGRPVLHQDSGFADWLPTGAGVLSFRSPEDVVDAVAEVDRAYDRHCRAARELAVEHFAAQRVLPGFLERAMAASAV